MNNLIRRVLPVTLLCAAPIVAPAANSSDAAPQAPGASMLPYRSAFTDYERLQTPRPGDWRALNDAVKGDDMAGMSDMSATQSQVPMSGMAMGKGKSPEHSMPMPMPMPKKRAADRKLVEKALHDMPGMSAMPGMPRLATPATPGARP